jgi:signal transduction histidine kinase
VLRDAVAWLSEVRHRARWPLITAAGLAVVGALVWFGSAGTRGDHSLLAYDRLLTALAACALTGGLGFALARLTAARPPRSDEEGISPLPAAELHELLPTGDLTELTHVAAYAERVRARLASSQQDRRQWEEAIEEIVEERTSELVALYERLRRKEDLCKRLLGKVLTAQEQERARLARELHDEIGQSLTAMIMTTLVVENSLPPDFVGGREKLINVRTMANQALNDLRGLIFDLRPEVLDDLGLALALRAQIKKHLEPLGIEVQLRASGLRDSLPHEVETAVFRVVQEAITNIARHAQATQVSISLARQEGRLVVRVRDNGCGFDTTCVMNGTRQPWGLLGMEERITLLGGRFYVSTRPGAGTLLLAEVPVDGEWVAARAPGIKGRLGEQDTRADR